MAACKGEHGHGGRHTSFTKAGDNPPRPRSRGQASPEGQQSVTPVSRRLKKETFTMPHRSRLAAPVSLVLVAMALSACITTAFAAAPATHANTPGQRRPAALPTATPIRHLVVIYNENVSFDHYFATYPKAANPMGEPAFHARPGTPGVDGLSGTLFHEWARTAVIMTWDDSDGWYDHAYAPVTNPSSNPQADQLDGAGRCGHGAPLQGVQGAPVNGRCGPGTRIPFLVTSPWAKSNDLTSPRPWPEATACAGRTGIPTALRMSDLVRSRFGGFPLHRGA